MSGVLKLEVATPGGLRLTVEVDRVTVPGAHGEFTVLPGHLPLLSGLRDGVLLYEKGATTHRVAVGTGFVEADREGVKILTERYAERTDVVVEDANRQLADYEGKIAKFEGVCQGGEFEFLTESVAWCKAQLALCLN